MTGQRPVTLARRTALRKRIAAYVAAHPGCTGNQLQAGIGGHRDNLLTALRELAAAGTVTRSRDPGDRRIIRYSPGRPAARGTCGHCGGQLPAQRRRFCSDLCRRRGQKAERKTENEDYARSVVRQIRGMGVRASADLDALAWLAEAAGQARDALALAVDGCRARGYSDADIGQALDITRQAVWKRFPRQPKVGTESTGTAVPA